MRWIFYIAQAGVVGWAVDREAYPEAAFLFVLFLLAAIDERRS